MQKSEQNLYVTPAFHSELNQWLLQEYKSSQFMQTVTLSEVSSVFYHSNPVTSCHHFSKSSIPTKSMKEPYDR